MAAFVCLLLAGMLLRFPKQVILASQNALSVWAWDIVPSLFPYMVLCKMTAQRLRATRFPIAPLTALLGWMGGSPSGAAMLSVSADGLTPKQFHALCALTGTISPMFFIGTLQAWGIEQKTCVRLLAAHWFGALLTSICVSKLPLAQGKNVMTNKSIQAVGNPITDSVLSVLGVGGCIVFFGVTASCIRILLPFLSESRCACVQAILEIAGGMRLLSQTEASFARDVSMAALTGFGGFSILTQNHLFLQTYGMTQGRLFRFAVLRAMISGLVMTLLVWLI